MRRGTKGGIVWLSPQSVLPMIYLYVVISSLGFGETEGLAEGLAEGIPIGAAEGWLDGLPDGAAEGALCKKFIM